MPSSLTRGLRLLELLAEEPRGVSALARELGVDKAGVSRTLTALHAEGWVLRTGARYVLGERSLGLGGLDAAAVRRRADRLARELQHRTGLSASVVRLSGSVSQPVAVRSADSEAWLDPPEPFEHLWRTAGGLALLAQLPEDRVEEILDAAPWPSSPTELVGPSDAASVRDLVRGIRGGGFAEERGWTIPGIGCVALPWALTEPAPPHAALVLGPADALDADLNRVRTVLRGLVAEA